MGVLMVSEKEERGRGGKGEKQGKKEREGKKERGMEEDEDTGCSSYSRQGQGRRLLFFCLLACTLHVPLQGYLSGEVVFGRREFGNSTLPDLFGLPGLDGLETLH
jgi:hypothetical protein